MAEKHVTINRREGDTIALLLVLKAHRSHVRAGGANARTFSIQPDCRQAGSLCRSPAWVRAKSAPREPEREGAACRRAPAPGSEASHISTSVSGAKSGPGYPAQMLTLVTGPSESIPALSLLYHIPHTVPAIISGRQGTPGTHQGHGACPGKRARLVAWLPWEVLARTTSAAWAVCTLMSPRKDAPSATQSQELRDTEIHCATCAKAVMSSAGLRLAAVSGAPATPLLPQGCSQGAVPHLKATFSLFCP